ncbi:unnamed protein product [Linum trigynum]|uniref:DYW domain-containing protein n=1 Tax=Linum trigynum TaxID=586398 RepID=A0AAV2DLJ8_9ROSI
MASRGILHSELKEPLLATLRKRQIYADILRSCSKNKLLELGIQVHGALLTVGFGFDMMLSQDLIDMYGKCGQVVRARQVFDRMSERNLVSWTSLMCVYVQNGRPEESLSLFSQLGSTGLKPNDFTLSTNLKACGMLSVPRIGMQIHDVCLKTGYDLQILVANTILDMYSKSGRIAEATCMFETMPGRNLITWNAMISGYNLAGNGRKALILFRKMKEEGEVHDEFTLTSVLKACTKIGAAREATQIHASLITNGFQYSDKASVAGSLIDSYSKCGKLFEARRVFNQIDKKHAISWSALILGYAQEGNLAEVMDIFRLLRESTIQVDEYAMSSMMAIFADLALLEQGRQIHGFSIKIPSGLRISVCNSALDMYLKCGMTEEAEKLFDKMPARDVVSWTVMITGYGKYGLGKEAIHLFNRMQSHNTNPDDVTYLAILLACSHSGLVEEGQEYLSKLCSDESIKPRVEHYACVVDLLGRSGRLVEAKNLISSMPVKPNVGIWQALLSACRVHGDIDMGREVGDVVLKMDGENPVNYVMLSNMFANAGYWEECQQLREMVASKKLKKDAGRSWVEIDKEIHFFYGGDDIHPQAQHIHGVLEEMGKRMKQELGYVNEAKHALYDVDEESKQDNLMVHSEKLAIGLALVRGGWEKKTRVIRVFKNLRVCVDCHEFIKGLSRILQMVFVVRDANRFHRFENGLCSCNDYW